MVVTVRTVPAAPVPTTQLRSLSYGAMNSPRGAMSCWDHLSILKQPLRLQSQIAAAVDAVHTSSLQVRRLLLLPSPVPAMVLSGSAPAAANITADSSSPSKNNIALGNKSTGNSFKEPTTPTRAAGLSSPLTPVKQGARCVLGRLVKEHVTEELAHGFQIV